MGATVVDDVEVDVGVDRVAVTIAGVKHSFMYHVTSDGSFILSDQHDRVRAWSDGEWAVAHGRARRISVDAGRAEVQPPSVTPPMPAVVVNLLVSVGDVVEKGARLLVVSAMKTETVLRAPHAGRVAAIRAAPGQNVKPGEILIDIAPVVRA